MANKKISELQSRTPALSDLMLVGDPSSGYSYKCTVTALATIIETDIADGYVTIGTTQTISGAKTFSNNLTLTSVANATTTQSKFLTLNASNVVNYRTGAEVLSDIGGVAGSGTTNYLSKFSATTTLANSQIFDNGTNIGIGTATPDATARVQINKTDGYGLFLNYTTNTGTAPTAVALWALNTTLTGGYAAIIEERTPVNNGGQYPFSIKHSLSSGTAQVGMGTGVHFQLPDDAGTFKTTQLTIETIDAAAATYKTRYRFNVQNNGSSTPIAYINATGLGVFTASPSVALDVTGEGKFSTINNATTDTDKFLVSDSGVLKYRTGAEVLSDIGAASSSSISGTTNYLAKFTSSSAVGNSQIFDNGTNVGIGTNTPSRTLDVNGIITTNNNLELTSANPTILWTTSNLRFYNNTNGVVATISSAGQLSLSSIPNATTDTDKFLVSDGGVVKYRTGSEVLSDIGAASSSSISGTTNYIPKFTSSSAIGNSVIYESGGDIGIGTTTLGGKFQVKIGTDLNIAFNSTGGIARISAFNDAISASIPLIINGDNLRFTTGGSERMRLDASGNLGLGTSSPNSKLEVYSSSGYNIIRSTGASGGYFDAYNTSGTRLASFGAESNGDTYIGSRGANPLLFLINGSTAMRLDASGNLGLGVTPNTWGGTGVKAFQFQNGSLAASSSFGALFGWNTYYDGSYKYVSNSSASAFLAAGNEFIWYQAPSGTAGNAISFTQAMTLDASGNLGIGSTSPLGTLHLKASTPVQYFQASSSVTSGSRGDIFWINSIGNTGSLIRAEAESSDVQATGLAFWTRNTTGSATERMRIDRSGNVGIGTTSPTAKLHLTGGIALIENTLGYGATLYNTSGLGMYMTFADQGNSSGIGTNNGNLVFYNNTNTTERMRITSGGSIQIGTSSGSGAKTLIYDNRSNSSNVDEAALYIRQDGTNAIQTWAGNGGTERMRITSTGNVGIGTTSPSQLLQVAGNEINSTKINAVGTVYGSGAFLNAFSSAGGNDVGFAGFIASQNNNTTNRLWMGVHSPSGANQAFVGTPDSTPLAFWTNATERMRITSGGDVVIAGTTATNTAAGRGNITIGGTSNSILNFSINGANSGYIFHNGSLEIMNSTSNPITFGTALNERMRITSGGNVLVGTTTDYGTYKLQVNGNGRVGTNTGSTFNITTNQAAGSIGTPFYTDLNFLGYADFVQARIRSWDESASTGYGYLTFWTNTSSGATEKMRLTPTGELLINTTSDAGDYKLQVNGSAYIGGSFISNSGTVGIYSSGSTTRLVLQTNSINRFDATSTQTEVADEVGTTTLTLKTGNATFAGSIKTAAPSGGTAQPWKLGSKVTQGGILSLDVSNYIEVEINGTFWKLGIVN